MISLRRPPRSDSRHSVTASSHDSVNSGQCQLRTASRAGRGRAGRRLDMADGTARPTSGPSGSGSAGVTTRSRRSWRVPVEKDPERPDFAVVRRLILGSALMLFLELALIR